MRHLTMRLWVYVCFIAGLLLLILPVKPVAAAANQVVLVFGGDVEWSLNYRQPTVRYRVTDAKPYGKPVFGKTDVRDQVTGDWPPIPYVYQGESKAYLDSLHLKGPSEDASTGESLSFPLPGQTGEGNYEHDYSSDLELLNYPLKRLAPIFHAADLVFVN